MKKQWKEIPKFNDSYFISNDGEIISIPKINGVGIVKRLKYKMRKGYLIVSLNKDAKQYHYSLHRLIAESFIPNPENKPYVNHINGIKTDNRIENLEWVTAKENTNHAFKNGLMINVFGEKHYLSKIKNTDIKIIRSNYKLKNITQQGLADKYGVSRRTITDILSFKTHKFI